MFLPLELLTLFFITNAAAAVPQLSFPPNVTAITPSEQSTISIATETTGIPDVTYDDIATLKLDGGLPPDSCATSFDPVRCSDPAPAPFAPTLPTETGWGEAGPASDRLVTLTPTKTTVTTIRPTIVNLETNTAEAGFDLDDSIQASGNNNGQPFLVTAAHTASSSNKPGQSGDSPVGGDAPSATGATSQQTGLNSLLLAIVSRLAGAPSNVQPASPTMKSLGQPLAPTDNSNRGGGAIVTNSLGQTGAAASNSNGRVGAPGQPATTPDSGMSGETNTASPPHVTPAAGTGYLKIRGSWVVTLTPGLSINLGGNMYPTMLELTTDATSNTLVTVSLSGTAVTATVRVALTTMTVPKSGFEASITDSARPGEQSTKLTTTSSKGASAGRRSDLEWWVGAVLGVLGFGVIL
ncbi:hypothetical protein G6011_05497 [Alternaria panax]|uniref:Uncharacterized protein n=1 Tax=Alternaria panax TaxID=48097 RepID=A0AAD4FDJ0_9PLEO|nr:hypothetical protein G6011_05497 [Alternaria panax]